jgi:hypothetical protein
LAYQRSLWQHNYDGVGLEVFLNDLSQSAIVCVSQFMKDQFGCASAARGVRRLQTDAPTRRCRNPPWFGDQGTDGGYELVTSFEIAGKDVAVGHPDKTWLNPRQVFRKYKSLRAFLR